MKEWVVHYEKTYSDGKVFKGSRIIKATNPGTAEDRCIRAVRRNARRVIIIGTVEN